MQRYILGEEGGPGHTLQMYVWGRRTTARQHKQPNAINAQKANCERVSTLEAINNSLTLVRFSNGSVGFSIEVKEASILSIAINCHKIWGFPIVSFDLMIKIFSFIFVAVTGALFGPKENSHFTMGRYYQSEHSVGDLSILRQFRHQYH